MRRRWKFSFDVWCGRSGPGLHFRDCIIQCLQGQLCVCQQAVSDDSGGGIVGIICDLQEFSTFGKVVSCDVRVITKDLRPNCDDEVMAAKLFAQWSNRNRRHASKLRMSCGKDAFSDSGVI